MSTSEEFLRLKTTQTTCRRYLAWGTAKEKCFSIRVTEGTARAQTAKAKTG